MDYSEDAVCRVIAQVLRELEGKGAPWKTAHPSGVMLIHPDKVYCENFQGRRDVRLRGVTTLQEAPHMAAGVMEVENTRFPRNLTYDEYDLVLSGTLEIEVDGQIYTGRPGDLFYLPKGSDIVFRSPDKARCVYITHPAVWNGG